MHSTDVPIASQKGKRKLAEAKALMLIPIPNVNCDGSVKVEEPTTGMLSPVSPTIAMMISMLKTKMTTAYSGFLYEKESNCKE